VKGLENDRRGRPREHPQLPVPGEALRVTFDDVTSGQKAPTRMDIAQLPVAHAHTSPKGIPSGSPDLRSHPVAMVLVLLYYILYYYYSKKKWKMRKMYYYYSSTKCTGCACARDHFRFWSGSLPDMWLTSLLVTWLPVTHDWPGWDSNLRFTALVESMLTVTTPMRCIIIQS